MQIWRRHQPGVREKASVEIFVEAQNTSLAKSRSIFDEDADELNNSTEFPLNRISTFWSNDNFSFILPILLTLKLGQGH